MDALKNLWRLTGIELFKIRRKSITWSALLIMGFMPVFSLMIQVQLARRDAVFPYSGYILFGSDMLLFMVMITVVVSLMALGNDYELKTVRSILSRGIDRYQFILAKMLATFAVALVNGLVYTLSALAATILVHLNLSDIPLVDAAGENLFWRAMGTVGVIILVQFATAAFAMLALVLLRQSWAGLLGGMGFFFTDYFIGAFGPTELLGIQEVYRYTVTYHALGALAWLFKPDPKAGMPGSFSMPHSWAAAGYAEPGEAVIFMLLFGCALTLLAILVFKRQDLMEQK